VASREKHAVLRNEFVGTWSGGGGQEDSLVIQQRGEGFLSDIFVPVWTSQFLESEWWDSDVMPIRVTATKGPQNSVKLRMENRSATSFSNLRLAAKGNIFQVGNLSPGETRSVDLASGSGSPTSVFVSQYSSAFQMAVRAHHNAFGSNRGARIDDAAGASMAACFISQLKRQDNSMNFMAPAGLDISRRTIGDAAVLLAWVGNYAPTKGMCQFKPVRFHKSTLFRIPVEIQ
jgi:hypothetical protein